MTTIQVSRTNWLSISLVSCVVIVQGRHLQRGSRLVDFEIKLGDSECVPVSLTDNQVDCRPATDKPNNDLNDTFCHGDTLSLQVSFIKDLKVLIDNYGTLM